MKIFLVYPYFLDARLSAEDIQTPPMGLYYLGAALKEHGHEVDVLNWHDIQRTPDVIEATLRARKPDVVGFSILHANRWGGIDIARLAKRLNPATTVVFGGVGATHLWEHLLTHFPEIDYIVRGEGEHTFLNLIRCLAAGDLGAIGTLSGLALRTDGHPSKRPTPSPFAIWMRCPCRPGISTFSTFP